MDPPAHVRALQYLAQLTPMSVMREAWAIAAQFEDEEFLRIYFLKHAWFIIPATFLCALLSFWCASSMRIAFEKLQPWLPDGAGVVFFILGVVIWLGSLILQLYVLLRWLERQVPRSRTAGNAGGFPWRLFGIFTVIPIVILLSTSTAGVFLLIGLMLLMPVIYMLLDR